MSGTLPVILLLIYSNRQTIAASSGVTFLDGNFLLKFSAMLSNTFLKQAFSALITYRWETISDSINKIIAETGVKIDIDDEGNVFIAGTNLAMAREAYKIIDGITRDIQPGEVYLGKVTRLMNFGAFVEILPNKEGLVHISKLDTKRVEKVEDIVSVGDEILVKVLEIDSQGRINLSRRDAIIDADKKESQTAEV